MILLHAGLSLEMLNGFLGGFLAVFIVLIVYGRKSKFFAFLAAWVTSLFT
jgi:hypothetical protein